MVVALPWPSCLFPNQKSILDNFTNSGDSGPPAPRRACRPFKPVDDLARGWCSWGETALTILAGVGVGKKETLPICECQLGAVSMHGLAVCARKATCTLSTLL